MCRVVGLVLFVAVATGCGRRTDAQDEETNAKLQLMRYMMMEQEVGNVFISGSITDENGEPLNGVKVTGYYQWMDDESGGVMEVDKNFDGVFAFSITNCGVIELEFKKDGYYKTELVRSAGNGEPDWGGRKKLEEHDISVVLDKQGELTVLTVSEMKADGTLSKIHGGDLTANNTLPEYGIYLAAEMSNSLIRIVDATNMNGRVIGAYPMAAKLVMCNSGDGFVGRERETLLTRDELRKMRQAPADGYTRELSVTPEGDNVFYFKMGSLYGKGQIGSVRVSTETNSCRSSLGIYLQEDGSRNLESKYSL
jgi:hypothetical protein